MTPGSNWTTWTFCTDYRDALVCGLPWPWRGDQTEQRELFAQIIAILQCVAFPDHDAGIKPNNVNFLHRISPCFSEWPSLTTMQRPKDMNRHLLVQPNSSEDATRASFVPNWSVSRRNFTTLVHIYTANEISVHRFRFFMLSICFHSEKLMLMFNVNMNMVIDLSGLGRTGVMMRHPHLCPKLLGKWKFLFLWR